MAFGVLSRVSGQPANDKEIHISYRDLDACFSSWRAASWGGGAIAVPFFNGIVHAAYNTGSLIDAVALVGATATLSVGACARLIIRNRVSNITNSMGEQGDKVKKVISSQLNKVGFATAISIAALLRAMYYVVNDAAARVAGGSTTSIKDTMIATGITITISGISGAFAKRANRKLQAALSSLPPPK